MIRRRVDKGMSRGSRGDPSVETEEKKGTISVSHQELSFLLYALEREIHGDAVLTPNSTSSCEEDCPIVESLNRYDSPPEKRLARHLSDHLRAGWIECGLLDLRETQQDDGRVLQVNQRLKAWNCEMVIDGADRNALKTALSRLPRSVWLTMPRTLWRLKRKLRNQPNSFL